MTAEAIPTPHHRGRKPYIAIVVVGAACLLAPLVSALTSGTTSTARSTTNNASAGTGSALDREIARLQQRLAAVPRDDASWATLGFDYVQQAKLTVDPTYYPKAAAALARSLRLNRSANFLAMAGEATLASARHDFRSALRWAHAGLAVDNRNALLLGALTDALTQLGHYQAAQQAALRMELVSPGTPAEARLSYAAELRGDHVAAVDFMRRALADSAGSADVAFARYYLGELALGVGDARGAMQQFAAGLAVVPTDVTLLEGRAKAESALGLTVAAVRDFRSVVDRVPQPAYVLEYGELLQSLGRTSAAQQEWSLFRVEQRLFRANGVTLDADAALFEADHGRPASGVRIGAAALHTRPFLDTYDAYGWALYRAGRNQAALSAANTALRTGDRNALFLFHRGEIERSLGLTTAARRDLSAAVRLNPHFSPLWAPVAQAHLRELAR